MAGALLGAGASSIARRAWSRALFLVSFLCLVAAAGSASAGSLLDSYLAEPGNPREFVFAGRKLNETDGHWYANIGYYAHDANRKAWREGSVLYRLELPSGKLTTLLKDDRGGIRDPQVHYDGSKILFSYRKGGSEQYHLYEINIDGSNLRQLTEGIYDDFEPSYLPNGDIVFVSTRCKRWVNCWLTQVAVMHRCDENGQNIRPISSNNEQDNTPWPLPDGRILYTRWEYIDRSQVDFHHLWAANPDGTSQMIWYGNLHPGIVMIDAKPIPNSEKVVAIFSPGHGQIEHAGQITIVDPKAGPDNKAFARPVHKSNSFRDPWAFSEDCFMAARGASLVLLNAAGSEQEIGRLPSEDIKAGMQLQEPRPIGKRPRERVIQDRSNPGQGTGRLVLADVYEGRNMTGVRRGEIKKLLVLETLPMPIHYTGGMDPISYGGTFTLERVVGTVPVEPDGSAYMELPALRSFFFVALDENNLSVKRMQSFLTVQPGEVSSCVGCHEQRTRTPGVLQGAAATLAVRRPPSPIQPIPDVPDVIDFPRDIQPILDEHCVKCHGYEKTAEGGPRAARLLLTGDHGPMFSHSYYMLTISHAFSDGRNEPRSNYEPRALGSSASKLLKLVEAGHHDVRLTQRQKDTLRLWIESGAAYPGTYAALGTGMIGGYAENQQVSTDFEWPAARAAAEVIERRCSSCHSEPARLLPRTLADERGVSFWQPSLKDPRLTTSRHIVYNLSRPEKSLIVLAPLSADAGGWGLCADPKTRAKATIFTSNADPDYQKLLALCVAGKEHLEKIKRFDMPGFVPRSDWTREMRRYGILPEISTDGAMDPYVVEREYWRSLWYVPQNGLRTAAAR